jgi:uncharacterized protein (DUF58 family)
MATGAGSHLSAFRGRGLEFDSVRSYVPGDDIRAIDWRVTARLGAPHIKLYREERERQVIIGLDMNSYMRFGTRNTFKSLQAAHIAALLGWQALDNQERTGGFLFGDLSVGTHYFTPSRTRSSFCSLLRLIAAPPALQPQVAFQDALSQLSKFLPPGALLYLISDFLTFTADDEYTLRRLAQKADIICIAVNDVADHTLSAIGAIGCIGNSNNNDTFAIDTSCEQSRQRYAELWHANRQQLYSTTSRLQIPLLELTTESQLERDLPLALKKLARGYRGTAT